MNPGPRAPSASGWKTSRTSGRRSRRGTSRGASNTPTATGLPVWPTLSAATTSPCWNWTDPLRAASGRPACLGLTLTTSTRAGGLRATGNITGGIVRQTSSAGSSFTIVRGEWTAAAMTRLQRTRPADSSMLTTSKEWSASQQTRTRSWLSTKTEKEIQHFVSSEKTLRILVLGGARHRITFMT